MIIWIDGPFGAGKTTLASRLCEKRSDLLVLDPEGLCCTNPFWDSSYESSVVAGIHEQTHTSNLQDQELAILQ